MQTFTRLSTIFICFLSFQHVFGQPAITSFSPSFGPIGSTVTITGENFSPVAAENIVYFGAVRTNVITASPTYLTVSVPVGASLQPITVTSNGLTAYSDRPFIITFEGSPKEFSNNSFDSKKDYETGLEPHGISIADLNNDGKPDIVTANKVGGNISVFKNNSVSGQPFSDLSLVRTDYFSGYYASEVAIGDLNGDGKLDVVASNLYDDDLSIYINTTDGSEISFAPVARVGTGSRPTALAIRDMNDDGKPDIAVSHSDAGTVQLLQNTSSGTAVSFVLVGQYSIFEGSDIAIADFDADKKPDIIATSNYGGTIFILRNNGLGKTISFEEAGRIYTENCARAVAVADIDEDGKTDFVVVTCSDVAVYRNTSSPGTISFADGKNYGAGALPFDIAAGDFDGDGEADIAVANASGNSLSVLKNTSMPGNIMLSPATHFNTGLYPNNLAAADIDADGKQDVVVVNTASNTISLFRNMANEAMITDFSPRSAGTGATVTIAGKNFIGTTSVSFGKTPAKSFTVDSATTITAVIADGGTGSIEVTTPINTTNYGWFKFIPKPTISSFAPISGTTGTIVRIYGDFLDSVIAVSFGGTPALSFSVRDSLSITAVVGGGGSGEVMVTTRGGSGTLSGFIYTIPPKPSISSFTPNTGTERTSVTIYGANLTGATSVDFGGIAAANFTVASSTKIIATVSTGASGDVSVVTPGGTVSSPGFSFYDIPQITSLNPATGPVGATVVITGAGFNEIRDNNTVYFGATKAIVTASSLTSITATVPFGATYAPVTVTTNGLTATSPKQFVVTFTGRSSFFTATSFKRIPDIFANMAPRSISIGDFDGDGKTDIGMVYYNSNTLSIYRNTSTAGNISFAQRVDYPTGDSPTGVFSADIDGDGKLDIATANSGSSTFSVFKNSSSPGVISLDTRKDYPTSSYPTDIYVRDLNSDGKPDIAIANGAAGISVFKNISTPAQILFASTVNYSGGTYPKQLLIEDFNGDGLPDIAVTNEGNNIRVPASVTILKNSSSKGADFVSSSFVKSEILVGMYAGSWAIASGYLDSDDKPDIVVTNNNTHNYSFFKNISTSGNILFDSKVDYSTSVAPESIAINDLDGDGIPDIAVGNFSEGSVSIFKNKASSQFLNQEVYPTGGQLVDIAIGDLDGDGKPDIVGANYDSYAISILRNTVGEVKKITLCVGDTITIASAISGTTYQWQVNTGTGYTDINDGIHYSGTTDENVTIFYAPSSWYGFKYRCIVDGDTSATFQLQFTNSWTGLVSSAWEDPANWSCNILPDINSDVIINSGTVVLSSNTSVKNLQVNSSASFTVNPGYTLIVLQ